MTWLTACCVAHSGTTLGVLDASHLKDLGLPCFDDPVRKGAQTDPCTPQKTQGSHRARKFQLGETLPVVPARIVKRVLHSDCIDMAELMEDNLELPVTEPI